MAEYSELGGRFHRKTETFTSQTPQILFWAGFWGVHKDDVIVMRVTTPTGEVWTMDPQTVPRNQAQRLLLVGKKHTKPWPIGVYAGEAVLTRQGTRIAVLSRTVTVSAASQ